MKKKNKSGLRGRVVALEAEVKGLQDNIIRLEEECAVYRRYVKDSVDALILAAFHKAQLRSSDLIERGVRLLCNDDSELSGK